MIHRTLRSNVLVLGCTLAAFSACSTQEIQPNRVVLAGPEGGANKGSLGVKLGIDATQGTDINFDVLIDGKLVAYYPSWGDQPFAVSQGSRGDVSYLDAGPHHFAIAAPGSAPIYEADGQIAAGGTTYLFLYWLQHTLMGRFVSVPNTPSAGNAHITIVNLIDQQAIEVVSCAHDGTCTSISAPLALGDAFDAEVPANLPVDSQTSLDSRGGGIAYRAVPSASNPDPTPFGIQKAGTRMFPPTTTAAPPIFVDGPCLLGDPF